MARTGFSVPSTLDMQVTPTSLAPSSRSGRSSRIERAGVVDGDPADGHPSFGGQHVPGDDVGVVLHLGQHDGVSSPEVGSTPGMGDKIESLGGVLGEQDLPGRRRRTDEAPHLGPGFFEQPGGLLGNGVHTAVDIGMGGLVVMTHGIEDSHRALGRCCRVEVDDGMPVDLAGQDREILAERGHIQLVGACVQVRHASYPSVSNCWARSGPPSATTVPSTSTWIRSASNSSSMRW